MAQLNITLDKAVILQLLLGIFGEAFRILLQTYINRVLQDESTEQLQAGSYEHSENRTDNRNGNCNRSLNKRIDKKIFSQKNIGLLMRSVIPSKLIVIAGEHYQLRTE